MSTIQPIKVYGKGGPNPPKIAMLLAELDIPHNIIDIPFPDIKKPEYVKINPNGRIPAIYDSNTDITLWESGAIVEYLIEKYDKDGRLSFPVGSKESYLAKQWLFFQAKAPTTAKQPGSTSSAPEKIPYAIERYTAEVNRVTGVLEGHLSVQKSEGSGSDGPWLVGNKLSYADLSFVSWQITIPKLTDGESYSIDKFPLVKAWIGRMSERKGIASVLAEMEKGQAKGH
ncbi:glutathione transferase 2 [Tothia fuscella]|uniref:Glutathione transferase 2 n=1 Tax=Tothia fuscella TaxID=1048955 RepID=A0A9P4NV47_9PEZI|nr:glutathione transferase 2 [Tothia fuscella]